MNDAMHAEPGVLDTAAVTQHEMVASYQRAGFSRDEAVRILIAIITSAAGQPPA